MRVAARVFAHDPVAGRVVAVGGAFTEQCEQTRPRHEQPPADSDGR